MHLIQFLAASLAASVSYALPLQDGAKKSFVVSRKPTVQYRPQAKSATLVANVTDPSVSRDSCGSVNMGGRTFWTCRDTAINLPGTDQYGWVFTNTVGWTDHHSDGSPAIQTGGPVGAGSNGTNNILLMKGPQPTLPTFYPLGSNECPTSGVCADGTSRWTSWPDSPPMVSNTASDGTVTAYTWISNNHISSSGFKVLVTQPSVTLHKMTYKPNTNVNVVPTVKPVDTSFWKAGEIAYGTYGNVVNGGYAYLYGLLYPTGVALARVSVASIEDKTKYQYYVGGKWTSTKPAITNPLAAVPNAGTTGQGTFYYCSKAQSYIWIGQNSPSVWADFYISTAPNPEGPWITPYLLYSGPNGDADLPSYSLQAHHHLLRKTDDGIYLTWTQYFKPSTYNAYVTPLVYVSFV
jgi:hypothetical protein